MFDSCGDAACLIYLGHIFFAAKGIVPKPAKTSISAGFQSRLHNEAAPQWVAHARLLARKHTEEWRIPGTENIVVGDPMGGGMEE